MNYYLGVLKNYVGFSGRAHRAEFWYFTIINFIVSLVLSFIDAGLGLAFVTATGMSVSILSAVYSLAVLLPGLAVTVRRLHDTNRSGWWILIVLIPFIGIIWLIVLLASKGTAGKNSFGDEPKN